MANYYATARSNYFKVKDRLAFAENLPDGIIVLEEGDLVGVAEDLDGGGWPSFVFEEDSDEPIEFDIVEYIAKHLDDDYVAVLMEAGAEKLRYVAGFATAVNSKGVRADICLHDIYKHAEQLGDIVTAAEY